MDLDLRQLLQIARRRWWIVALLMVVAGTAAFVTSSRETSKYSASATLLVISGQPDSGNDYTSLQASRSLADTYRLLIETGPVLQLVIDELELPYTTSELRDELSTTIIGDTQLVEVAFVDTDPDRAALVVNTIAEQFQTYITNQVDPRIGAQVEVADPAEVPSEPVSPQPRRMAALGVFVGLLLGVALVALLEFLDNTVKPDQNIQELAGAPLLATMPLVGKLKPGGEQVYVISQPNSSASEAQRLLRTNLEFASASSDIDVITVTSPGAGEGKSTTAANLGVVMAQAGLRTVVIDADLRKPTQARIFGVPNETGLTTLLTHPEESWRDVALRVALPGLELIASGPLPPNPSDLLSSTRFESLLASISEEADIVIVDSPPVLAASDALSIAAHTDGVVMVCHSHQTRTDALRHAAHSVHQGGIRLIGVVLNRQRGQQGASYYGEYYGPAPAASSSWSGARQ